MNYSYHIQGMTCNGCRAGVESTLNQVVGVKKATVDLETASAILEMDHYISLHELQHALPEKYILTEKNGATANAMGQAIVNEGNSTLRQLVPLFIVFGYITGASVLLNYNSWDMRSFMLDFMGLFYIVFSFFKVLDVPGFSNSFRMYDPLARMVPLYGWIYPFLEIALGLLFLMRLHISIALIATILVLGLTTIGVSKVLLAKKSIQCACLGTVLNLPMTKATFIENTIMILMATSLLFTA